MFDPVLGNASAPAFFQSFLLANGVNRQTLTVRPA